MGVVLDPNEIVYPPKWSRQAAPSNIVVVPQELRAYVPGPLAEQHEKMRTGPDRAAYWRGVDWRKLEQKFPSILEPFDQKPGEDCVGPAVAAALRLNLAVHRKIDVGALNRFFISAFSQARAVLPRSPVTGMLEDALTLIDQYGTPKGSQVPTGPIDKEIRERFDAASLHKAQGFDRLGTWLGQWAAWLRFSGPIVVQMNIERIPFDALSNAKSPKDAVIQYTPGQHKGGPTTTIYASHVVVLLGYIPKDAPLNADSFILLNSFGKNWGDNGIAYVPVKTAQQCFIAGYGLTFREHFGYTYAGKMKCFPFMRRVSAPMP